MTALCEQSFRNSTKVVSSPSCASEAPAEGFDDKREFYVATVRRAYPEGRSIWDKLTVPASLTLREFQQWLLAEHGIKMTRWDFVVGTRVEPNHDDWGWGWGNHGESVVSITVPVFPPKPALDYGLLPPLELNKAQALQQLQKSPAASRAVQHYLKLWSDFKAIGAVPPQPPVDPTKEITDDTTIAAILDMMARTADDRLARGEIKNKTAFSMAGRKFLVAAAPNGRVHAETGEEVDHMAAIRFVL